MRDEAAVLQSFLNGGFRPKTDIRAPCCERQLRAQPVSSILSLRARARKLPQMRGFQSCRAVEEPAIRRQGSISSRSSSHSYPKAQSLEQGSDYWSETTVACERSSLVYLAVNPVSPIVRTADPSRQKTALTASRSSGWSIQFPGVLSCSAASRYPMSALPSELVEGTVEAVSEDK